MSTDSNSMPKVLQLYLEITQYPILGRRIRQRMREELFQRGIITQQVFEAEVREKAIRSQQREGITNPVGEEPLEVWEERLRLIRDHLTDFYFAYNLHHDLFREIVAEVLTLRVPDKEVILSFNPELAPWDVLFQQGELYENAPPEKRAMVQHHLQEIIVVLIKAMISDQLSFVRIARKYFTVEDLKTVRNHRIGRGKIGGKAAGMLLAYKIIQRHAEQLSLDPERIAMPESWYLGSDVYYTFHQTNELFRYMNQKYKRPEQMREDYPVAYNAFLNAKFPEDVEESLRELLEELGNTPVIVRSSSLLEDNFDTSFAGKYDSYFLPNQGTLDQNLKELTRAIILIYASVIRPEALIYRDRMGLIDYDERMAILIQRVEGRAHGKYFFPAFAGVGFSHNPFRWNRRIRLEDGLLRLVAGLGTRAVDRVANDYPRMVALSHPTLRPEKSASAVRYYSQHFMDVINMEENCVETLPITDVLALDYKPLGAMVSLEKDGYVQPLSRRPLSLDPREMVLTFDRLVENKQFVELMRSVMNVLEEGYGRPVDIEFAGDVIATYPVPQVRVSILQCRPLSQRKDGDLCDVPDNLDENHIFFTARDQIPTGCVKDIRYVVYVDPRCYASIKDPNVRLELGHVVGRLNQALVGEQFILMGPGRWGSSNIQLGVKVNYADIYNTRLLIELAFEENGTVPEISYGTHFFQDLVEANIYPLPLYPDDKECVFNEELIRSAPNALDRILPADVGYAEYVKVIDLEEILPDHRLTVVMSSEDDYAIGYLKSPNEAVCPIRKPG